MNCPAGKSTVTIQGTLDYVNNALFQASIQQVDTNRATSSGFSLDSRYYAVLKNIATKEYSLLFGISMDYLSADLSPW
ncbi:hypothetical protein NECAME_10262 [Necator americanus]|uniref:Uncharacterized protein n=1 Tax=Necator americanus TaxID=51031 RepID=W2TBJ1_NECAM|nr:hypothetical protein NECAME_10262 [Necator americanus]ETN78566.1 hypothetical protein NECAME_10262 [Necator americanus]